MIPEPIGVGILGAGALAEVRARCYPRVPGGGARVMAVVGRSRERVQAFASEHGIAQVCEDMESLLERDDVQLIEVCAPTYLRREQIAAALTAGKHVVVPGPLAAYVGQDLGSGVPDEAIAERAAHDKADVVLAEVRSLLEFADASEGELFFAEPWIHAPAVARAMELVLDANGAVLDLRGTDSGAAPASPWARRWKHAGGGALQRRASHPLAAMVHVKRLEGEGRDGAPIVPVSVTAEIAEPLHGAAAIAETDIPNGYEDVETWASVTVAFSDGTCGHALGADTRLGGEQHKLSILGSNVQMECNLTPGGLGTFGEAGGAHRGWSKGSPDQDAANGNLAQCESIVDAIRTNTPCPTDARLALMVTRVVQAAYTSADEGRRISLQEQM
jgi:predicted dehydrogenase